MKTIEEKAKRYDEVVNKLARFIEQGVDPLITRADVKDIFPELAESEAEKIRKEIITYLSTVEDKELIPLESWLAWLEKQKPADIEFQQGKEDVLWCIDQCKENAKDENEMGTCWFAEQWLEKQKPAEWSEEDEKGWTHTMIMIKECAANHYTKDCIAFVVNWLKSLRPQKQWKVNFDVLIDEIAKLLPSLIRGYLKLNYKDLDDYKEVDELEVMAMAKHIVKNLNCIRPQKQWKPTEEQIEILQYLCEHSSHPNPNVIPTLESLYEQLKQL